MDWLQDPVDPMLATLVDDIPVGEYLYEVKWDGIRALITLRDGSLTIRSRNKNDITRQFPELEEAAGALSATNAVLDGEIICLDREGKPSFKKVVKRTRTQSGSRIASLTKTHPAYCYLFDCLYLNGEPLVNEPLHQRQDRLRQLVPDEGPFKYSDSFPDGHQLFQAARGQGMEGIMAKHKDSRYQLGNRSDAWKKVKVRETTDCLVIGYTQGEGGRSNYFGALHVAQQQGEEITYRGKVGTGFSDVRLRQVYETLSSIEEITRPSYAPDVTDSIWIRPVLQAEISYNEITQAGAFRAPVFIKLKHK